jgi:hypothetical protein
MEVASSSWAVAPQQKQNNIHRISVETPNILVAYVTLLHHMQEVPKFKFPPGDQLK